MSVSLRGVSRVEKARCPVFFLSQILSTIYGITAGTSLYHSQPLRRKQK